MAHRAPLRKVLIKALANKRNGNELMDAIVELQVTINTLVTLLETNKADITGVDFAALEIEPLIEEE
jgi:hypothetical protein